MARFYCPEPLVTGELLELPASTVRHVQVLRLQPGDRITLFNGGSGIAATGGEFEATVTHMGRSNVQVMVGGHHPVEREAARAVHLAVGMPANERMDWLVEKATELGVASIQPLITERSVVRIAGERAEKKVAHWKSVTVAACEQSGGNVVPVIHAVMGFAAWTRTWAGAQASHTGQALLLSLRPGISGLREAVSTGVGMAAPVTFLSGPEGGLTDAEEESVMACGFTPVTLGPRTLRAETAALSALAALLL
jgi:16S rRNA (uracil1498-N3)-methyltransferase